MLEGKRIIITRAASQAEPMHSMLRNLGAEVSLFPVLSIVPASDWGEVDKKLKNLGDYEAFIFTSANGVRHFCDRAVAIVGPMEKLIQGKKIYAVGPETSNALMERGVEAITFAEAVNAEQLMECILESTETKTFLFPHGNLTPPKAADILIHDGRTVHDVVVYQTVEAGPERAGDLMTSMKSNKVDMLTFFSPSAVRAFTKIAGGFSIADIPCAVIGGSTAIEAEKAGFKNLIRPAFPSTDSMLNAIMNYFLKPESLGVRK